MSMWRMKKKLYEQPDIAKCFFYSLTQINLETGKKSLKRN